jgi:arylsulfatase A-like enzyme
MVAPVFLSEVKAWHLAVVAATLGVGLSPGLLRFRPRSVAWARASLLLLLIPAAVEWGGRPKTSKPLRILQASLLEQLLWDGWDRLGEEVLPPTEAELAPLTLRPAPDGRRFNLVLVLLESQGARSTSLHPPNFDTTPNLAALAEKGWWARSAYSVVPHTSKSIVTTLCGAWPQLRSEIREAELGGLPQDCLPSLMRQLGYRTAFFQTADERFEDRGALVRALGFDLFRSRDTLRGAEFETVNYFGVEDRAMLEPGLEWSTEGGDQPFFATYLTLTSHHDYGTPTHWEKQDFPQVKARQGQYLNAVRYVDDFVGRLVSAYEAAGHGDDTLFVILGDHGEAFSEHGRSMHDLVIWDEGVHIPLVLYGPGVLTDTGVIEGNRQQIDIVPTVLDLLGVETEGGALVGESLFSPVDAARRLYHSCWRSHRCLARRTGGEKIIDHYRDQAMQVFDIASDPLEKQDLRGATPPDALDAARADMRTWRARVNGRYEAVRARALAARQRPAAVSEAPLATWGGKMDLLGCQLRTAEALPGEAVWVSCEWRPREVLKQAWRLDLRLEGPFEPVAAHAPPLDGLLPTFKWTPGTAYLDEQRVFLPPDAKPGFADVYVGWERYGDAAIEMDGGGDRHRVGSVKVLPSIRPYVPADAAVGDVPSQDGE